MGGVGLCFPQMQFIYVLPGWEGSVHDGRVLRDAINRSSGLKVSQELEMVYGKDRAIGLVAEDPMMTAQNITDVDVGLTISDDNSLAEKGVELLSAQVEGFMQTVSSHFVSMSSWVQGKSSKIPQVLEMLDKQALFNREEGFFFGRWFFRRQLPHAGFLASANGGSGSGFSRRRHQGVIGLRRRLSSPLPRVAGGSGPSSHPTSSFLFRHTTATTSKGACPVEEEDTCAAFVAGHASPTPTLMPQRSRRLQRVQAAVTASGDHCRYPRPPPVAADATDAAPSGYRHLSHTAGSECLHRPWLSTAASASHRPRASSSGCRHRHRLLQPLPQPSPTTSAVVSGDHCRRHLRVASSPTGQPSFGGLSVSDIYTSDRQHYDRSHDSIRPASIHPIGSIPIARSALPTPRYSTVGPAFYVRSLTILDAAHSARQASIS
ncbi:hypothetical protein ZIOFF_067946 [Zingiber officinale]|uniref:Uncharacterized protein n=1 Tax=Zingiber officinale TaxID=94328 RepID=A0A8J5CXP7_ZINOF|nr:hypothetical protein ZIOFF_067946 [Zingiber officinale]